MRLGSVRELKQRIFQDILPEVVTTEAFRMTIGGFGAEPRLSAPHVAFGATVGRSEGQYALAIRLFDRSSASLHLARRAAVEAAGEFQAMLVPPLWAPRRPPAAGSFRARVRPLSVGYSVGHRLVTAGTLGAFVVDRDDYICALSNNHVLAASNRGRRGDPIFQNAVADAGGARRGNIMGYLSRRVPLRPAGNVVDAALSTVDASIAIDPSHAGRLVTDFRPEGPLPGERVWKVGRTTGVTQGVVRAIDVDGVRIDYSAQGDGSQMCTFDGQIEIQGIRSTPVFSRGGDSGSVILDVNDSAVGLLFAGNRAGLTYANPIGPVFQSLGVTAMLSG
jgi:hypothetical protein